jgi:hypothetical protein
LRNNSLSEQEIKLLNLVKLIVSGGWIIDESIMREVIIMAGLGDITIIKFESQATDIQMDKSPFISVYTLCQNFGFKNLIKL